jgi:outer membrane protein TolC
LKTPNFSQILASLLIISTIPVFANQAAPSMTLKEAINLSFQNNPISKAGDARVEASKERWRASKLDNLPSATLSASAGRSQGETDVNGISISDNSRYTGTTISVNLNIFNGGASYYRSKAAEASAKAQMATNNSTNSLIPYTRGALANKVYGDYLSLSENLSEQAYFNKLLQVLERFLSRTNDPVEIEKYKTLIESSKTSLFEKEGKEEDFRKSFQENVKVPAPKTLDNLDGIIAALVIPATAQDALRIADEKSPELEVARRNLESAKYSYQSQVASTTRPRVDLNVSNGRNNNYSDMTSRTRSTGVGVSLTVPLNASSYSYNKATAKEIEALEMDLERESNDLRYQIEDQLYPKLSKSIGVLRRYEAQFAAIEQNLNEALKRAELGKPVKVDDVIFILNQHSTVFTYMVVKKMEIIDSKFSLQKKIGSLFDNMGLQIQDTKL